MRRSTGGMSWIEAGERRGCGSRIRGDGVGGRRLPDTVVSVASLAVTGLLAV